MPGGMSVSGLGVDVIAAHTNELIRAIGVAFGMWANLRASRDKRVMASWCAGMAEMNTCMDRRRRL
jgi:hypothetical protein